MVFPPQKWIHQFARQVEARNFVKTISRGIGNQPLIVCVENLDKKSNTSENFINTLMLTTILMTRNNVSRRPLVDVVVSMFDCHPRALGFESWL